MGKRKNNQELNETEASVRKKKRRRNRETMLVTYFFVFLMLAMMGNLVYFVVADSETTINNSYNPRQELLASKNIRGKILDRNGEVLAQTLVGSDGTEMRDYPYGNLFAHVVGYSTKGKTGVEALGNIHLLTSNAFIGERIKKEIGSEKNYGDNVVTTLDLDLQKAAYNALGVYSGAIVVSEPSTGKILAMVSKPDFDPNQIVSLWDELIGDDTSSVLVNRASQGLYPPGSTFKIITALEYYRQNQGNVEGYSYKCAGSFVYEGHKINCYHGSSHGSVNFQRSFEKSCNSSFVNIGLTLDLAQMEKDLNGLLFNGPLPTDIISNKSSYVLTAGDETYDVMQTVIGQGKTQMTPLHLNMLTCAIANGGKLMRPYVIDRIENYSGSVMKQYSPTTESEIMTVDEAGFLKELMAGVVENGTATKLKGLSYTAAGKTGSAEFNGEKADSHAWFTGFAPVEDPQIAVTIIVEGAGSGGDYAVPMARRIFDEHFGK
ncbi:MAG: penicillin-binding transpeptidase domain-containing protein [Roseburia sp.]|nr:penicillin-binding transpeptidase domain-containing protein [Roseburia sp.]MCM1279721.1 penicillin-binding transpeptidase domain-containing protein [Robinsoniella sp.]